MPTCNCFYTRRVNSRCGKLTSFTGYHLTPFERISSPNGTKFYHEELQSLWQLIVKISWSQLVPFWRGCRVWQSNRHRRQVRRAKHYACRAQKWQLCTVRYASRLLVCPVIGNRLKAGSWHISTVRIFILVSLRSRNTSVRLRCESITSEHVGVRLSIGLTLHSCGAQPWSLGTIENRGNTEIEAVIFVKCRDFAKMPCFAVFLAKMP